MTNFEIANRHKKVAALLALLQDEGIPLAVAESADALFWAVKAKAAGVKPPSKTTIALVLKALDALENPEPECMCHQIDVDLVDASGCPLHDQIVTLPILGTLHSVGEPGSGQFTFSAEDEECPF